MTDEDKLEQEIDGLIREAVGRLPVPAGFLAMDMAAFVRSRLNQSDPATRPPAPSQLPAETEQDGINGRAPSPAIADFSGWLRRKFERLFRLVPAYTSNTKLVDWIIDEAVEAGQPLPDRRAFLNLVTVAIRAVRAEAYAGQRSNDPSEPPATRTLADAVGTASFDTVANQVSEPNAALARVSLLLDEVDPELGEVLRLAFYAGQPVDHLAALLGCSPVEAGALIDDARQWALAQELLAEAEPTVPSAEPRLSVLRSLVLAL